jgi:glycosyltransferase involved in cell wall biosynthesis
VRSAPRHSAIVRFSAESVWDARNPWTAARECVLGPDEDADFDVVFVSGTDWRRVIPEEQRPRYSKPVVNLIQHVRHADAHDPLGRHMLLRHSAIRICVSPEVEQAIMGTGRVRGPVFTIPDAIDVAMVEELAGHGPRDLDVVVAANKQPGLGQAVARRLEAPRRSVHLVDTRIPRPDLIALMGRAHVAVTIPNPTEGFYLPAIEAMAAGALVVCADCIGNRSYCIDGENSFRPAYGEDAIVAAAERALASGAARERLVRAARATARAHDLPGERRAFLEILDRADELWAAIT